MLRHSLIGLVMAMGVTGCSTFSDIDEGMTVMRGKPVNDLIGVLGFPDAEQEVAGRRFVVWSTSRNVSTVTAVPNFTGGPITYAPTNNTYACTIKVELDEQDRILGHEFQGNIGGCERYAKAIRNI